MAQEKSALAISFVDSNGDVGTVRIHGKEVNDTDNTLDILDGLFDSVHSAVTEISSGVVTRQSRVFSEGVTGAVPPTDPAVQREMKWIVFGHGVTTFRKASLEIPAAKTDLDSGDIVTPSEPGAPQYLSLEDGTPGKALKDALDAAWRLGPDYGELVVTDRIELVTRG